MNPVILQMWKQAQVGDEIPQGHIAGDWRDLQKSLSHSIQRHPCGPNDMVGVNKAPLLRVGLAKDKASTEGWGGWGGGDVLNTWANSSLHAEQDRVIV